MRNYRHLPTFTLALFFLSGAFKPFSFFLVEALAVCTFPGAGQRPPNAGALMPLDGTPVTCSDADTAGIDAVNATDVTVTIQSPDGSISVTDAPGIRLGNATTVIVEGDDRPITVQGDNVPGIEVGDNSNVSVEGVVSTTGNFSPAIATGSNSTVNINGGAGRQQLVDPNDPNSAVVIVSDGGIVSTAGQQSAAVTVGAGSTVNALGRASISTTGVNSDAVVLNGNSQLTVGANATVTTAGSQSNAVQMSGASSQLTVNGTVSSAAADTAAVMGTANTVMLNVASGGTITTLSTGANAIEMTGTGAQITVADGGAVRVTSGNSTAIIAGSGATVEVSGTVSAAGSGSQGIVIGEGAVLTVKSPGRIETSTAATQAVLIDEMANSATVNVENGAVIAANTGQAIVDTGATSTLVMIDGNVVGSGSAPAVALGDGNDNVTVNGAVSMTGAGAALDLGSGNDSVTLNGSVTGASASPVIDLGSGNDTLSANSSQGISGAGVLASGGAGQDTLNLNNGITNNSANYQQFETINVGMNTNANDPLNGTGSTLDVTDNQSGNQINVASGGTLNVRSGGAVDLRADGSANPSGVPGNRITFAAGSTANVQAQNVTGAQPLQTFINTTFAPGTMVGTGSGFIRGVTSNDTATGTGQIQLSSDFTNSAQTANGRNIGRVLNELASSPTLTAAQQTALNALIANATDTREGEAILSNVSGEVQVHAATSGLNAALGFNEALLPAGNRTSSRNAVLINGPKQDDNESNFYEPTISNGVWVSGLGSALSVNSNDNSTAFDANGYGIAVGYDRVASEGPSHAAVFGIGAGYSTTNVSSIRDSATVNAFSVGTYFDGSAGALSGNIAASYSSQDVSSSASNGGSGSIFALSSEVFYNVRPNAKLAVGPIGQIGAAFGSYSGFSTNNNAFTVTYSDTDVSQANGAIGVRFNRQDTVNHGFATFNLDLLYESSLGDNAVQFDGQLGGSDLSIAAPSTNRSGFLIGAETGWALSDASSLGFRYQGRFGNDIQSHTGEIQFSLMF